VEIVGQIGIAVFLAWLNERLVEKYLGKPLEENFPQVNRWWLVYAALVLGFAWSWFFGVNVISWTNAPELPGRVLTGILIGSGSEIVHQATEWFKNR
jgi:uncharacterized BrkB/YihY/UPF0761 family membrane protein